MPFGVAFDAGFSRWCFRGRGARATNLGWA